MKSALPHVTVSVRFGLAERAIAIGAVEFGDAQTSAPLHVGDRRSPSGRAAGRTPGRRRRSREPVPDVVPAGEELPAEREGDTFGGSARWRTPVMPPAPSRSRSRRARSSAGSSASASSSGRSTRGSAISVSRRSRRRRSRGGSPGRPPAAAEEQHVRPSGDDRQVAGLTERESLGAGVLAGERVGHDGTLVVTPRPTPMVAGGINRRSSPRPACGDQDSNDLPGRVVVDVVRAPSTFGASHGRRCRGGR